MEGTLFFRAIAPALLESISRFTVYSTCVAYLQLKLAIQAPISPESLSIHRLVHPGIEPKKATDYTASPI
jgi:hypothetical protein